MKAEPVDYDGSTYWRELQNLYQTLDGTEFLTEVGVEPRKQFFRRMRGRFLQVSRLKRNMHMDPILDFLKLPKTSLPEIENGTFDLSDRQFLLMVTYLGCASELPLFLSKFQRAMALKS